MTIHFAIDIEPEGKGRPRFARRGRFVTVHTPAKTLYYENQIRKLTSSYRPERPLSGAISVVLLFGMPIPKSASHRTGAHVIKPDIDNLIKSTLDPLNGIFWNDDSQIYSVKASKVYSKTPGIEFIIEG